MESKGIFAQRINELINASGKTQKTIAEEMNISPTAVSDYRRGDREPGAYALKRIADYFGVSLDYLAGKHECKTPKREKIRKLLGLSDEAITALRKAHKKSPVVLDPTIAGINTLLEHPEGLSIARLVNAYVHGDFAKAYVLMVDDKTGKYERVMVKDVLIPTGPNANIGSCGSYVENLTSAPVSSLANSMILEVHENLRQMREAVAKEADPNVNPENPE